MKVFVELPEQVEVVPLADAAQSVVAFPGCKFHYHGTRWHVYRSLCKLFRNNDGLEVVPQLKHLSMVIAVLRVEVCLRHLLPRILDYLLRFLEYVVDERCHTCWAVVLRFFDRV